MKRLLLLGAGPAHLHVLQGLAASPLVGAEVRLIAPATRQLHAGLVPGLVEGHLSVDACTFDLEALARAAGAGLVPAAVVGLDAGRRCLELSDGQVAEYDLLSINAGALIDRDRIPGARENALFLQPFEPFVRHLDAVFDLAARRALDLVVIGGGVAGVELALAFEHRLAGLSEHGARVALVTGGPAPLEGLAAGAMASAAKLLARRRITVIREACVGIAAGELRLARGARLACDVPVVAGDGAVPGWLRGSGLALDELGRVVTGPTLQSLSHAEVFASGDMASRPDAPRAGGGARAPAVGPPLLRNLRAAVAGTPMNAQPPQRRWLELVACGDGHAIAAWGGWSAQGRWVGRWKDRVDRAWVQAHRWPAVATPGGETP